MNSSERLSPWLDSLRLSAQVFHAGLLCGTSVYDDSHGLGFIHMLREGELVIQHPSSRELPARLVLSEPSLVFYPRPVAHRFLIPARGAQLVCATVRFDGGRQHPLAMALPPLMVLPLADLPVLKGSLDLLFMEADAARSGHRQVTDRLLEILMIQLIRWLHDHPERYPMPEGLLAGLAHPQLSAALIALQQSPAEPWQVETLARCAGMSRSAFAATFREVMGSTPADYLAGWRLTHAQQRLARGEPLKRVALEVGYGSASALSRAFVARFGSSPRAWLKARHARLKPPTPRSGNP